MLIFTSGLLIVCSFLFYIKSMLPKYITENRINYQYKFLITIGALFILERIKYHFINISFLVSEYVPALPLNIML